MAIALGLGCPLLIALSDTRAVSLDVDAVGNSFAWFGPEIVVSDEERQGMDRREVVSRMLPADGDELALLVASTIRADAGSFAREIVRNERLWSGKHVPHVVRFSTPPRIDDVAELALGSKDLDALRTCTPGDCDIKLSQEEIERVRSAIDRTPADWQAVAQDEFRRIVVDRAATYLAKGQRGLPPYVDKSVPVDPQGAFEDVIRQMPLVTRRLPSLVSYFDEYPKTSRLKAQSFLFWIETTYTPRPTIQIIHEVAFTPDRSDRSTPEVIVARRQVYATHYISALLSISALLRDERAPSRRYLVYMNRSKLDVLGGWLQGVKRHFVEGRVRNSAEALFEAQRQRIEATSAPSI